MTPQLRFPEFTDQWEKVKLSDVAGRGKYGMNAAAKPYDGINKYLRITDIDDESRKILVDKITSPSGTLDDSYLLKQDDIVLTRTGASTGKSYIYQKSDGKVYFAGFLIRFRATKVNPYFAYSQTLRRPYDKWIAAISARSGQPGVNAEEYGAYSFYAPQKPEQEKIADFMGSIESKLISIQAKVAAMHEYKKGVMQAIFSGKLRFKDENDNSYPDWKKLKMSEIFDEITERVGTRDITTYSITAGRGFVSQAEKFGKDISGMQNEKYTLLKVGELAYNKGNSKSYSFGCVYANYEGKDIAVPNVFISFRLKDSRMTSRYFEQLFTGHYLDRYLRQIISSGARMDGLLNVSKKSFFEIPVTVPVYEEQQKIANFLAALDDKIKLEETKLASAKEFKKALLQRMFV